MPQNQSSSPKRVCPKRVWPKRVWPKRVWYVQAYAGGPGIGRYHRGHNLGKAWQTVGIETHIFCGANNHLLDEPKIPGSSETINSVIYHFVELPDYSSNGIYRFWNMLSFGRAVCKYISKCKLEKPCVIIYSSPHLFGALSLLKLSKKIGAKFVFEVRDLWPLSLAELTGMSKKHPVFLWLRYVEKQCYRSADAVVSLLPKTCTYMESLGLKTENWHYIPNGIVSTVGSDATLEEVTEESEAFKYVLEQKNRGKRVLVYAGALGIPNQVEQLVRTVAELNKQEQAMLSVVIIGRGTQYDAIKTLASSLPIKLFTQIPKHMLVKLLSKADGAFICLAPSQLFQYGISPNKIFDYMLAGLPIISAIKAGNDPVEEAGCGFSFNSERSSDTLTLLRAWLASDAVELSRLGQNGKKWVMEHHDYSVLSTRYLAVCRAV